jgi:PHP family Zn ribbon phosphoesterase
MLVDLHCHSCLSPCASLEMSPSRIAGIAASKGIGLAALTDHNSARNCPAFRDACQRHGIVPLFGMEVTTAEECHVLAIFDHMEQALSMDQWIRDSQPRIPLNLDYYNDQAVVDADDIILDLIEYFLGTAVSQSLEAVRDRTLQLGGLFIPSHINRPSFSIESQLGFLPPGHYDAIEVLPGTVHEYRRRHPSLPVITSSDAHSPEQIGTAPFHLKLKNTDIESIRSALLELTAAN